MKFIEKIPPRVFTLNPNEPIATDFYDCGEIHLKDNELISFKTDSNKSYDITKKNFGYYATPSLNGRLKDQGFKSALIKNSSNRFYLLLVENNPEKLNQFFTYLKNDLQQLVCWLDEEDNLKKIDAIFTT